MMTLVTHVGLTIEGPTPQPTPTRAPRSPNALVMGSSRRNCWNARNRNLCYVTPTRRKLRPAALLNKSPTKSKPTLTRISLSFFKGIIKRSRNKTKRMMRAVARRKMTGLLSASYLGHLRSSGSRTRPARQQWHLRPTQILLMFPPKLTSSSSRHSR
eukprot:PhF_6_TR6014/c0_g2_i1/m.8661